MIPGMVTFTSDHPAIRRATLYVTQHETKMIMVHATHVSEYVWLLGPVWL